MEQHLPTLQAAAANFVKRLKPSDLAQVVDFDSRVEIRQGFTANQADLEAAILQTVAGGSTSLHNAIYIALRELRKIRAVAEEDVRRQALIVFSDGEDTSSLVSFDEVLELAKRSETSIYTIALRGADTQSKGFREAEFVLRSLARETGGRAFFPLKIDDLTGVYAQIADELASRYTLGYTSMNPKRDGAWRLRCAGLASEQHDPHQERLLRPEAALTALLAATAAVVRKVRRAKPSGILHGRAGSPSTMFTDHVIVKTNGTLLCAGFIERPRNEPDRRDVRCIAGCASKPPRVGLALPQPNPNGCYVFVYDQPEWQGARVVLNGPDRWPSIERLLVDEEDWRNRIRSIDVGPAATVTVYTDAAFTGVSRKFAPKSRLGRLDGEVSARIESLDIACPR